MAASPVRKIAGYELEGDLAEGGMGVVRRARQPELDRPVVLKTLRRDVAQDASECERFLREARAAGAIHHPNVVGVYDCFLWRGERTIVQEYVDGLDLETLVGKAGPLEPRIAALIALEIARGLEEIHARGLVHRDLKPSNVLLGRGGEVKIADFGVALDHKGRALTQTGHSVGTPLYMSPEQLLGERVEASSDRFSFGVLLYEMLCGRRPFEVDDTEAPALVRRIETGVYPSVRREAPGTSRALAAVVRICLRGNAKRRFGSTTALRRILERRLSQPSPADCRREIAEWLAASGELPTPRRRTRKAVPAAPAPEAAVEAPARSGRLAMLGSLLVLGLALAVIPTFVDVASLGQELVQIAAAVWELPQAGPNPFGR